MRLLYMAKTAYINVRADESIKKEAELILEKLGLSPSDAINLFYNQITLHNGLPFEVRIPNQTTIQAINDLENNINITDYENVEDYFKKKTRKSKK